MGLPAVVRGLTTVLGRPEWGPGPSRKELLIRREQELDQRLRFLAEHVQFTACFVNSKGGASKTTTAVYVGSTIADVTNRVVFALPATRNTKTSTLARRSGIRRSDSISVTDLAERLSKGGVIDYADLSQLTRINPSGLRVIPEEAVEQLSGSRKLSSGKINLVIDAVQANADVCILDTGNDDIDPSSIVMEAVRRSDIIVATATGNSPDTLESLWVTLVQYLSDDSAVRPIDPADGLIHSGRQIPTKDKAKHAIMVFSHAAQGETPDDYAAYTQKRDESGKVIGDIGLRGPILTIPEDQFISARTNVAADPLRISQATRLAYKELAVQMYQAAAELKGIVLP
jgi:cellulose biosynthesis protein BcsQ